MFVEEVYVLSMCRASAVARESLRTPCGRSDCVFTREWGSAKQHYSRQCFVQLVFAFQLC